MRQPLRSRGQLSHCLIVSAGCPSLKAQAAVCLDPRVSCLIVSLSQQGVPPWPQAAVCLDPRVSCLIVSLSQQGVPPWPQAAVCLDPRVSCLIVSLSQLWLAGRGKVVQRPRIFFGGSRNHVVDATTRSDTTCSRRWGQTTDLSARLAASASEG